MPKKNQRLHILKFPYIFILLLLSCSTMPKRFSKIAKVDENQRYVNNYLEKFNSNDKGGFFEFFLKNSF